MRKRLGLILLLAAMAVIAVAVIHVTQLPPPRNADPSPSQNGTNSCLQSLNACQKTLSHASTSLVPSRVFSRDFVVRMNSEREIARSRATILHEPAPGRHAL